MSSYQSSSLDSTCSVMSASLSTDDPQRDIPLTPDANESKIHSVVLVKYDVISCLECDALMLPRFFNPTWPLSKGCCECRGHCLEKRSVHLQCFTCDSCSETLPTTHENFGVKQFLPGYKTLHCYRSKCKFRLLAVSIDNVWCIPQHLLTDSFRKTNDIVVFKDSQQNFAVLKILVHLVMLEYGAFRDITKELDLFTVYIVWHETTAIGYYAMNRTGFMHINSSLGEDKETVGMPILRQLFVRKEYRRRGFATKMLLHFLEHVVGTEPKYGIDEPETPTMNLLVKMGEVTRDETGALIPKKRCVIKHLDPRIAHLVNFLKSNKFSSSFV